MTILYLVLSVGISLNLHFCKDEVYLVLDSDEPMPCSYAVQKAETNCHTNQEPSSCCSVKALPMDGCCYDEGLNIKFSNEQQVPSPALEVEQMKELDLFLTFDIDQENLFIKPNQTYYSLFIPPPKPATWLQYQQFTFYG